MEVCLNVKLMQLEMVSADNSFLSAVLHGICRLSSSCVLIDADNFLLLGPFHFISSHLVFSINCRLPVSPSKMVFSSCNKSKNTIVYFISWISCYAALLVSSLERVSTLKTMLRLKLFTIRNKRIATLPISYHVENDKQVAYTRHTYACFLITAP